MLGGSCLAKRVWLNEFSEYYLGQIKNIIMKEQTLFTKLTCNIFKQRYIHGESVTRGLFL